MCTELGGDGMRRRVLGNIVSENLHNPETDIHDVYLNNGIETAYNGWSATDWIPVETGTYLLTAPTIGFISGNSISRRYNALYGIDKKMIRIFTFASDPNGTDAILTVPDGVYYARFSSETNSINDLEVYRLED